MITYKDNPARKFKLGKLPVDKKKLACLPKFSPLLVKANLPTLLAQFDNDVFLNMVGKDGDIYGNDKYGDCGEAGSAHWINHAEKLECGACPPIQATQVVSQYLSETSGQDSGLVLIDHLNLWQRKGLNLGGQIYTIDAFAVIDWNNHKEFAYTIQLLSGAYIGFEVPKYFMDGFEAGKRSFTTQCKGDQIEGGHCVYVVGFDATGIWINTWGVKVHLDWKFVKGFVDEAYAIVDSIDKWANPATDPLNVPLLKSYIPAIQTC